MHRGPQGRIAITAKWVILLKYRINKINKIKLLITFVDIEVVCTTYEGIDAIKRALKEGFKFATKNVPVKVRRQTKLNLVAKTNKMNAVGGVGVGGVWVGQVGDKPTCAATSNGRLMKT